MSVQVLNNLNLVNFTLDFNLIRLHGLLDLLSNIRETNVNSSLLNSCICSILNCQKQIIINWVKGNCEGCVDDSSLNMGTEIDFTNIIILQDSLISWIRGVMSSAVVDRDTCRESDTTL
jgi:hypothetical protein